MDLGLAGKNAIVTGSSRGIGRATALEFAAEGANVAICARGQEALDSTRDEIEARGVNVHAAICDVADPVSLKSFLNGANDALGGIDILINNPSGRNRPGEIVKSRIPRAWLVWPLGAVRDFSSFS